MSKADAQSGPTSYSGLPKTVHALANAQGPAGVGAWVGLGGLLTNLSYNYGTYVIKDQQVIVQEPGIYVVTVRAVTSNAVAGQNFICGTGPLAAGAASAGYPQCSGVGMSANARLCASDRVQLKQGDDLALWVWCDAAHSWLGSDFCSITVTKDGGQY